LLFLVAHRDADNATAVTAPSNSDLSNDEISNLCTAVKMYIRRQARERMDFSRQLGHWVFTVLCSNLSQPCLPTYLLTEFIIRNIEWQRMQPKMNS
jgi:hypothetical protein